MSSSGRASPRSLGGAHNEAGGELRARVGALLATIIISHVPLSDVDCPVPEIGYLITVESDDAVDDLVVRLAPAGRAFLQVKRSTSMDHRPSSAIVKAVAQFATAVKAGLGQHDYLVLATARPSRPLLDLGELLKRERTNDPGAPTSDEQKARDDFVNIAAGFLSGPEIEILLERLSIWKTDPTEGDGRGMPALTARSRDRARRPR